MSTDDTRSGQFFISTEEAVKITKEKTGQLRQHGAAMRELCEDDHKFTMAISGHSQRRYRIIEEYTKRADAAELASHNATRYLDECEHSEELQTAIKEVEQDIKFLRYYIDAFKHKVNNGGWR